MYSWPTHHTDARSYLNSWLHTFGLRWSRRHTAYTTLTLSVWVLSRDGLPLRVFLAAWGGLLVTCYGAAAAWGACPPAVRALFEAPRRQGSRAPTQALTRYAAPDGTLLLLTENGTRLMTRAAAASLLRAALLSPRPPQPRHGEPPHHPLLFSLLCVSLVSDASSTARFALGLVR